jgi:hypothetical protein
VHALPSVHGEPSPAFVGVGQPVDELHVPATLQAGAVQTSGLVPVQVPLWQRSVCVQTLLSEHTTAGGVALSVIGVCVQVPVPVLHVSVVHGLLSL